MKESRKNKERRTITYTQLGIQENCGKRMQSGHYYLGMKP